MSIIAFALKHPHYLLGMYYGLFYLKTDKKLNAYLHSILVTNIFISKYALNITIK